MGQFSVYRNPGRNREVVPFVISLQNRRFERAAIRLVAALVVRKLGPAEEHPLAPRFMVRGQEVMLDLFNLASVMASRLGEPVAELADDESRGRIQRALDEFLSQV